MKRLVEIKDLKVSFSSEKRSAYAVRGLTYDIMENEVLGIVGESGSGKSVSALSILKLIPEPPGKIENGSVVFKGKDLLALAHEELRGIRGNRISMIFQEPMTSLNPVFTIGMQLAEPLMVHRGMNKKDAFHEAVSLMKMVGIPSPEKRLHDYPHQYSGGMRQRIMIAMALGCNPDLLIADEPTTALDVTIQAQILELMLELKSKRAGASILLITHDLAVVAEMCDRVAVMYAGLIQEQAPTELLFESPLHPYTEGLMLSIPSSAGEKKRLFSINGSPPDIFALPKGCPFSPRCLKRMSKCADELPELVEAADNHFVRCHLYEGKTS